MLIQSALLGAGSLDQRLVKALRARPSIARRYLALEGRRVLAELAGQMPLAAALLLEGEPSTATADESLEMAKGRAKVAEPPEWFGVIRPSRLLATSAGPGAQATDKDLRLQFDPIDLAEADDDDDDGEQSGESKILKLFDNPLFNITDHLGLPPQAAWRLALPRQTAPPAQRCRSAPFGGCSKVGANARPLPTRIHFTDDGKPGAAVGVGGALYPEWDVYNDRYRARLVPGHRLSADSRR